MWLFNSSIGKKVLMSVSGIFLVLFLIFHACMNFVAVFSLKAYDVVCGFLGANWYAVVGTMVLAGGFLLHICVAFWLTLTNQKARGDEYAIANHAPGVSFASKNMLPLGIIVLVGLFLHFYMFWSKMMLAELIEADKQAFTIAGIAVNAGAAEGGKFLLYYFSQPVVVVGYIIWLGAIWCHLNHGFWSALQTMGLNNDIWMKRLKLIATIFTSVVVGAFAFVVLYMCFIANMGFDFVTDYLQAPK
ncbi:MAG: succinate dehydrogenase/fumarate reductase cytochrome b subunit [Paludibacteraceae bacterium]|nr:succinate dehydrogenase/fumarate reductase cytochrome b subunit [Paludibacteraceae bacterium]